MPNYDMVVIGSGFAGSTATLSFLEAAEKAGRVALIEAGKRGTWPGGSHWTRPFLRLDRDNTLLSDRAEREEQNLSQRDLGNHAAEIELGKPDRRSAVLGAPDDGTTQVHLWRAEGRHGWARAKHGRGTDPRPLRRRRDHGSLPQTSTGNVGVAGEYLRTHRRHERRRITLSRANRIGSVVSSRSAQSRKGNCRGRS